MIISFVNAIYKKNRTVFQSQFLCGYEDFKTAGMLDQTDRLTASLIVIIDHQYCFTGHFFSNASRTVS